MVVRAGNLEISVGSDVNQEHKGLDLVRKKATLEPGLQNRNDISTHAEHAVIRDGPKRH
jgi:hypothetical protein